MMHDERRALAVTREGFDEPAWLDTAVSWALLERVSAGEESETLRVYRPGRVLAFGPADRVSPGYGAAHRAAQAAGFAPVERLAGGRAAVFHEDTIAFAWTVPDAEARTHIHARFEDISSIICDALRRLGVDANVGAAPGEYCPGDYSVNVGGARKLMGVGQRVFPRAAHIGGVIVVDGANRVRDALVPVYDALGLEWNPSSAGSISDEIGAITRDEVTRVLLDVFAERFELCAGSISAATLDRAGELRMRFAASPPAPAAEAPASSAG